MISQAWGPPPFGYCAKVRLRPETEVPHGLARGVEYDVVIIALSGKINLKGFPVGTSFDHNIFEQIGSWAK